MVLPAFNSIDMPGRGKPGINFELPEDFRPVNQDGEVAEFRLLPVAEVLRLLGEAADLTLDASLVMLSFMARHGYLPQDDPASIELARLGG